MDDKEIANQDSDQVENSSVPSANDASVPSRTSEPAQSPAPEPDSSEVQADNLGLLMDMPLSVSVELGRKDMLVKEIVAVTRGSVIELDKLANEPIDILINNKKFAEGEIVVVDDSFGVRIAKIVSDAEGS